MSFVLKTLRRIWGTNRIINQNIVVHKRLDLLEKKIQEIYNAQIFNSTIKHSEWLQNKSFSPGRWAVDYSCLYVLYRILNDFKPKNIVEFGLGQSTRMLQQYANYFNAQLVSFENERHWLAFFKKSFPEQDDSRIKIVDTEIVNFRGYDTLRFKQEFIDFVTNDIEFVFVDAPLGSPRFSRSQILDLIPDQLNVSDFCILFDDTQRGGEQDTLLEIQNVLNENNISFKLNEFKGETTQTLICSPNNSYLLSI